MLIKKKTVNCKKTKIHESNKNIKKISFLYNFIIIFIENIFFITYN
jgi:hypothetical protein